jgi:glycosyltransferase involved in cell wall biosynthesis
MIVGNFYFIKNTNGLFHYGVEYLRDQRRFIRQIVVRPSMAEAARVSFPGIPIIICKNMRELWCFAKEVTHRGDVLYTPTSHPLPFINQQWIVVHDAYPFLGGKGRLKRMLFRVSLALSRCRVAYINETETLSFVRGLGVARHRLIFAPNVINISDCRPRPAFRPVLPLKVGLVGTDSEKKQYDNLLEAITKAGLHSSIEIGFYGHPTPYLEGVLRRHPGVKATLQESDVCSLDQFLAGIDTLVSIACHEGFGRPIAVALMAGVPCFLIRTPVFMEFFPTARFFHNAELLVTALEEALEIGFPEQPPYALPLRVRGAYDEASRLLSLDAVSVLH